jgi:glycosyltransferase involved in cell wall biosynthesis
LTRPGAPAPIRIAFPLIDRVLWRGGYNYLLNLFDALRTYAPGQVVPVVFCAADVDAEALAPLRAMAEVEIVTDPALAVAGRRRRLIQAFLLGRDPVAARLFRAHRIDLAFESAAFYGWRAPVPALAWIPDLQHRHLPALFSRRAWLRRDIGFQVLISTGRRIMLSSEDARSDFARFYRCDPARVCVVRFAVPPPEVVAGALEDAQAVARGYGLPETFFYLPNQFWAHKNHTLVVEALARLRATRPDIVVACSGETADPRDPGYFQRLSLRIEAAGLGERLRILGVIPRAHVLALMRGAAALINPSRFEGWSTTVEEAKAMGTPMILSALNVHREQAAGLPGTLFFDPSSPDALAMALAGFVPASPDTRVSRAADAALRAGEDVKRFAQAFVAAADQAIWRKGSRSRA